MPDPAAGEASRDGVYGSRFGRPGRHDYRTMASAKAPAARQQQGIQSVEIGMDVLAAIEAQGGPATLSELSASAGMPASKTHRYLVSLMRVGLVVQDPQSNLYDLGPRARRLGLEALRRNDEISLASGHVTRLRDRVGHTTNLSVWTDLGPTIVRWDTGWHALTITFQAGSVLPLLESSVGRVFLTFLPAEQTRDVLARQQEEQQTRTLPKREVEAIKRSVAETGIAYTSQALVPALAALAAPVLGDDGQLRMVIGLAFPSRMADKRAIAGLTADLRSVVHDISVNLGYVAPS
jgi:DNA-binding IclR family transcriptional regulator